MNTSVVMNFDSTESADDLYAEAMKQFQNGQHVEAERLCKQALLKRPDMADAENMLGAMAHMRGDLTAALQHMSRAAELSPETPAHNYNLAMLALQNGDIALAKQSLDNVLQRDFGYEEAMKQRLIIAFNEQDYPTAEKMLTKLIEVGGESEQSLTLLVEALTQQERYTDALPHFDSLMLISQNPTMDVLMKHGLSLHHMGDHKKAAEQLEAAIARGAAHPEAFYRLGKSYETLGDKRRAELYYNEALNADPIFQPAQDALAMLKPKH